MFEFKYQSATVTATDNKPDSSCYILVVVNSKRSNLVGFPRFTATTVVMDSNSF